jgi:hypothetical protein
MSVCFSGAQTKSRAHPARSRQIAGSVVDHHHRRRVQGAEFRLQPGGGAK